MEEKKLYDKYLEGNHWENHPTIYAERFSELLKQNNFKGEVIDFGCGNGRDVNCFNKKGFISRGIDNNSDNLALAKNSFPSLKFEFQDIENLNFRNSSVDTGFMINVIHYLDKNKAFREVLRVLKPGAYFFIHFNLEIKDSDGKIDYQDNEENVLRLIKDFKIIQKRVFERIDSKPFEHTHKILELTLQKPIIQENNECIKCNYRSPKNKLKFEKILCEFCHHFAPDEKELFEKYAEDKTNWRELQTYRKQKKLRGSQQKEGMLKKAKEGKVMSRAAFGYEIRNNNLVPHEENAKIVEIIFLDFKDNEISLNKLSAKYNFSINGLKKILTNFTYVGKIKFDGQIHPGTHKPLISSILFNQVQDKLERLGIKRI